MSLGTTYIRITSDTEDGKFLIGDEFEHNRNFTREGEEAWQ